MHRPNDDFSNKIKRFSVLPFVKVDAATGAVSYWNVEPSGDYSADCAAGRQLAMTTARFIASERAPNILAHIVQAMPRQHTGVEVGFLFAFALLAAGKAAGAAIHQVARIAA